MLDTTSQISLFSLLNIITKTVGTLRYQIWTIFLSGDKLVKFRNIKKYIWISKYDVSIHPSVILQLLMSSQRSLVTSKNTFWYLKMMSAFNHQWYCSWLFHLRGYKWSPDQSNCFVGTKFQPFWTFCTNIYMFPTNVLVMGQNQKYKILYWDVHNTYRETS